MSVSPTAAAPGSTAALRTANQDRVVRALRSGGELTQAEVSRLTELAPATVSNIVKALVGAGVLTTSGGSGRRGATVRFAETAGVVAGVDFGHSHLQVSVGDLAGHVLAHAQAPLDHDHDHDDGLGVAAGMLRELIDDLPAGARQLHGVGLGLPAPIGPDGVVDAGSILPGWIGVDAVSAARQAFGVTTIVDNDANLGALAEFTVGAGAGATSMVYIKVSSGVGCGLVLDGRVYRGGLGTAGELGHITLDESGPLCRCGSRGCLEAYVGGSSLVEQYSPVQRDLTVPELVARALDGDTGAHRLIEDAGRHLGHAVSVVANLLGPETIVVGGEVARAGDLLLDGVRDGLRRHALEPVARRTQVLAAALGTDSSAVGSVLLALEAVRLPV